MPDVPMIGLAGGTVSEHVYVVKVARTTAAIVADLATADTFIGRYLALCWPKADPEPAEHYQFGDRREDYHHIPRGEYTGGELLPVIVQRVYDPETNRTRVGFMPYVAGERS